MLRGAQWTSGPHLGLGEDFTCTSNFPGGSDGKESTCKAGDPGSIPGSGRSPGEGNGILVLLPGEFHGQRSWQATVHGVAKRQIGL